MTRYILFEYKKNSKIKEVKSEKMIPLYELRDELNKRHKGEDIIYVIETKKEELD